ncbi:alpha/beta hydrolase [uncultured Leifsonia sp.]|uniref:alpha/beta hydrolase n=1 Tax=uncultured Leifsonia sp. TaxID=340359 RepID=UPI0028D2D4D0|nr:alpha/beta hydrolase [uncultured Leifsonia sp.]
MTAGDKALAGSADTVREVGSALAARTVGTDVYSSVLGAATALGGQSGSAVSVERILTRIQAASAPANTVQQADAAWGTALDRFGSQIADLKRRARLARDQLATADGEIDAAQSWLDGFDALDTPGDEFERRRHARELTEAQESRAAALHRLRALDEERAGVDAAATAAITEARAWYAAARNALPSPPRVSAGVHVTVPTPGGGTAEVSAVALAQLKDPATIRARWDLLSHAQQQALIADCPLLIGNLEGIPLRDRNTANVITATGYRAELEKQIAALGLQQKQPGAEGLFADAIADLRAEIASIDAILGDRNDRHRGTPGFGEYLSYDEHGRRITQQGTTLVAFNPYWDSTVTFQGMLDPVTGDIPAWMSSIGISVPGTTSGLGTLTTDLNRTKRMFEASLGEAGYFTWHGAPLPEALPEAAERGFAEVAAPRLASFANSLRLPETTAVTVIGHSYGAAVLGGGEVLGLRADRVVYVSPAGLGHTATGLTDFPNTKDKPHFLVQSRNDLIGLTQGLSGLGLGHGTTNPTTVPGIVRLETGYLKHGDPASGTLESTGPIDSHTKVFTFESTSFTNIVNAVIGEPVSLFHPDRKRVGPHGVLVDDPGTGVTMPEELISPRDLSPVSG